MAEADSIMQEAQHTDAIRITRQARTEWESRTSMRHCGETHKGATNAE